jgi:hypothetical protein
MSSRTIYARALSSIRALRQRTITTQSHKETLPATGAAVQRGIAAALAISRDRGSSGAEIEATAHQKLVQNAERRPKQQMKALEPNSDTAVEGDDVMLAAADHLRGIPLRSKREYKQMIAAYTARRS